MMSKESETVRKPVFSQKCKQQVPAFSRQESIYHIGMCVTDLCTRRDCDDIMRKRMALYKELGLKTVRTTIAWSTMEPEEGQWQAPPEELAQRQAAFRETYQQAKALLMRPARLDYSGKTENENRHGASSP